MGYDRPDQLPITLSDIMEKVMDESTIAPNEGLLPHEEGVALMPANISLSGMEVSLVNAMNREKILKQYLDSVKCQYDYVLIDCMPSLGMLTINALAAADSVIIPVQAQYLSAKGLEQLLQTVNKVRRQINQRYPDHHGGQPHQLRKGDWQFTSGYLRQENQSLCNGYPSFRPRC